jgi:hypothetical protein
MHKHHRYAQFEELISLKDAGDWLRGEYIYVCRGRRQIACIALEDLQIPKDSRTTGQITSVDFILKDILEETDEGRPLCQSRIGELALLIKKDYCPNANAFVWRGLRRELFSVVLAGEDYKLERGPGKLFMGWFEFYTIHPFYFRERQEAIRQCIEKYHSRMERKAEKSKSSSEPQP